MAPWYDGRVTTAQKAVLLALITGFLLVVWRQLRADRGELRYVHRAKNPLTDSLVVDLEAFGPWVHFDPAPVAEAEPAPEETVEEVEEVVETAPTSQTDVERVNGVEIQDGQLVLEDWNVWMEAAAKYLRVTLEEGSRDPNEICTNLFRRMFPQHAWPPPPDSVMAARWQQMVAAIGRTIERPFKPHFEIVS